MFKGNALQNRSLAKQTVSKYCFQCILDAQPRSIKCTTCVLMIVGKSLRRHTFMVNHALCRSLKKDNL